MREEVLFFFDRHMDALPLYEAFESRILGEIENVRIKVQKSQISFYNKHMFACVSFMRIRNKKDVPSPGFVVTVGLGRRLESPRIEIATEPYPGRFTHHIPLSAIEEIDDELLSWVKEAAAFSERK